MKRIAMISVHTCPLAALGGKETGGMNVYVREVSRQLGRSGVRVDVFTRSQNPAIARVVPLGTRARVIHIPAGPEAPYDKNQVWYHLPQFSREILNFVRAENIRYDLIHSHYWLSGWVGLKLRDHLHAPLVHMFHTLAAMKNIVAKSDEDRETVRRVRVERKLAGLVDRIVASTPADRAHIAWYYGANPAKTDVIPCGVDLTLFRPLSREASKNRIGLKSRRVILFVGRIQPIKGLDSLLEAMAILVGTSKISSRDLRLLIVGGDLENGKVNGEMGKLRTLSSQLGLDGHVAFLGAQPQDILPYFYSAADLCILPSLYESFGMVALEAMACGIPVIASRVGGLIYTIRDGETGYLIPEGNPRALADSVETLLRDDSLRMQMGRKGMQHARRFTWETVAQQILSVYHRTLTEGIREDSDRSLMVLKETARESLCSPGS